MVAAFATGYCTPGGYASGIMLGEYRLGAGRFILNTLNILSQVGTHPVADRLLLNLIHYAVSSNGQKPPCSLSAVGRDNVPLECQDMLNLSAIDVLPKG